MCGFCGMSVKLRYQGFPCRCLLWLWLSYANNFAAFRSGFFRGHSGIATSMLETDPYQLLSGSWAGSRAPFNGRLHPETCQNAQDLQEREGTKGVFDEDLGFEAAAGPKEKPAVRASSRQDNYENRSPDVSGQGQKPDFWRWQRWFQGSVRTSSGKHCCICKYQHAGQSS